MSLLELKTSDLLNVKKELEEKVQQAPSFFKGSAVVFGLEQLSAAELQDLDLRLLHEACCSLGMLPTAIRGGTSTLAEEARKLGMPALPKSRSAGRPGTSPAPEATATTSQDSELQESTIEPTQEKASQTKTKIVTAPIRSGQQIYAPGSDLIVMSSVSAGAEVLADGNIHIYGALRGRALAGIQGDESARIFCTSQEAELVSVAGQFLVDEVLRNKHWKQAVQIYLEDGRLTTAPLV